MKNAVLALVAAGLSSVLPVGAATLTTQRGDLVLTVYQEVGGGEVGQMTYSVNLGSAADFKYLGSEKLGNIDAALKSAFGTGWATDSTLRFVVVGSTDLLSGIADDSARTTYAGTALSAMTQAGATSAAEVYPGNYGSFCANISRYVLELNGKDAALRFDDPSAITFQFVPHKEQTLYFNTGASNIVGKIMIAEVGYAVGFDLWHLSNAGFGTPVVTENLGTLVIGKNGDIEWFVDEGDVSVSQSRVNVAAGGENGITITVTAAGAWDATTADSWITGITKVGNTLTFNVESSTVTAERRGYISVTCGSDERTIVIVQDAFVASLSTLAATKTSASADGETITITGTTNTAWTASGPAWLGIATTSGGTQGTETSISITLNVQSNLGIARSDTVTVVGGGITRTITISQAAFAANLTVAADKTNASANGDVITITGTTNTAWTASGPAWLGISQSSGGTLGTSSSISITLNIAANLNGPQSGTVTIEGSGITRTITISQAGFVASMTVNADKTNTLAAGDTVAISGTSNTAWTVTSNSSWLVVGTASGGTLGSDGPISSAITVTENKGAPRSGIVTVKSGDKAEVITINQQGTAAAVDFDFYETRIATRTSEIREMNVRFHNAQDKNVNFKVHFRAPVNKTYTIMMAHAYDNNGNPVLLDDGEAAAAYGRMWASDRTKDVFTFDAELRTEGNIIGNRGLNFPMEIRLSNTNDDSLVITLKGLATLARDRDGNLFLSSATGNARAQGMYPASLSGHEQGYADTDPNKAYDLEAVNALRERVPADHLKRQPSANGIYYPEACLVSEDDVNWFLEEAHFHGAFTMRFNARHTNNAGNNFGVLQTQVESLIPNAKK